MLLLDNSQSISAGFWADEPGRCSGLTSLAGVLKDLKAESTQLLEKLGPLS